MNYIEFYYNRDKYKGEDHSVFLQHYGILGQKWGQRRWQNADGTFNEEGKERYFGKGSKNSSDDDKTLEKAKKKADKINAKIEKAVQSRLKHPLIYNAKDVNEDELRKFFTAYYNTPLLKRNARGIEKTFNNMYNSEINSKMINNIKNAETAQWLAQQELHRHLQDHLNIHHLHVHHQFMGKPNKKQIEEQKELNKEIKELTNSIETSFNIPDKFKEYKKEITDQVSEQIAYMIRSNPDGELPKKIDVNISDDGRLKIDFAYDDKDQKIGFSPKEAKKLAKEAKKLEKELENAKYQDKQKIINDLINDDKYKDTIDEAIKPYVEKNKKNIDRVNEIFKDYEDNEINNLANAGIVNSLLNKWGDKNNNETMKELAGYAWFYLNDDGNQSDNTAEYLYATIDKGVKAKELGNLWDNLHYSNEEKNENISSLKKDPFLSNLSDNTLKEVVTNKFESKFNKGSYWNLYNASDTYSDPNDTVKNAYKEAKNISKKLEKSCGNTNGWDYFWKAIDNLNMGDMNYKDLSQADWDRINAEINKLKK